MREGQVLSLAPVQQIQQLIEGPRRGKLTFAVSEERSAPIRLDRIRRVREPVSRSKSGVQGKVADVSSGRSRHAESQNELKAFQVLMATARSDAGDQPPVRQVIDRGIVETPFFGRGREVCSQHDRCLGKPRCPLLS
jgi:hypothetical protein